MAVGDGDTTGVGVRLTVPAEAIGEGWGDTAGVIVATRGDTVGEIEGDWLLLNTIGDMVGDTEVTLVTIFDVTIFFTVTIGVTMSLGDTSEEILALPPKIAERLLPYPGP